VLRELRLPFRLATYFFVQYSISVTFGHTEPAGWLAARVVVAEPAELTATAVKPKPLARTTELARATTMRVRMTFMT